MFSWKSIPFLTYCFMHGYLFKAQWNFINQRGSDVNVSTAYPLLMIAVGCFVDNLRFSLSALFGLTCTFKWLMYVSYWCHLVFVPVLFTSLTNMLQGNLHGHVWMTTVGHVITAVFVLHGVYEFQHRVAGNLVLKDDMGFTRYTLRRDKSSFILILPVILVSVYSIAVGVVMIYSRGMWLQFIINIVCFIGQAQTPRLKEWGPLSSNFLEAVFLAVLMSYQINGPNVFF